MSLARQGTRVPDELVLTQQKERHRLHETHQPIPRARSPCRPPGKLQLRANLTGRAENLAGHSKDFTGCRGENIACASDHEITGDDGQLPRCIDNHHHLHRDHLRFTSRAHGRVSRALHPRRAGEGRCPR